MRDTLPRDTRTLCPTCGKTLAARLYERAGDVWMASRCPEHGELDRLFWKDAGLYRSLKALADSDHLPPYPSSFAWEPFAHLATTLAMDPTLRCNLSCPDCFSQAEAAGSADPPLAELLARVPGFGARGFRPNIALVGGESSLRQDLPDLVRGLLAKNCTPRLNSNGIRLLDAAVRKRLKDAGLRWVILQFDGFSPEAGRRLRGRDLIREKLEVIDLLGREGFSVHLAVMLAKGVNDCEAGRILEFALANPHVRRLSFYPRSRVGRNLDSSDGLAMHLADVIQALETGTAGRINREDLLEMKRLWHLLYRLTGRAVFRQRICITPFVVLRSRKGLLPLNRVWKPGTLLGEPSLPWHLVSSLGRVLAYDRADYPDDILLVNIEKFYHSDAFDLDEAMNCHHIYLTPRGCIPFCLYNSFYRSEA